MKNLFKNGCFVFPWTQLNMFRGKEKKDVKKKKKTPCEAAGSWWEVLEANWWKRRVCFAPKRRKLLPSPFAAKHTAATLTFYVRSKGPETEENMNSFLALFSLKNKPKQKNRKIVLYINGSCATTSVECLNLCFCLFSISLKWIAVLLLLF